ncbi:single-stranded-DNA-specific exonuclease RecJ [Sulfurimonas sp.]|jgi:single-stranded-DNA-specific exonuclease|uniref:single-stranded-DNA-specific exonuclease RecJ n=1 Tax=Sulfurimonas sp. TaxID=2022749 RepID=UPI0025D13AE9|nr:single-stranded-DNA-specific exonuclease RecJ [Sulfurimonas sp.]MCK9472761.1 single-stranded-DNA-specific exonuclease RecJ [Sulfurimonas sp.]MDD3506703.1 single-stranded-DNA-specific exonuclease RecJ [Sulfurimonas sp.]
MHVFDDVPILNKSALFELLSQRLDNQEKTLSQIPNPSLLHDAPRAAKKIADAIINKRKITVVGDYDVDGISSTAIMVDFFKQIPYPLQTIIPNRFNDGYGVSPGVLNRVDADIVITVDNGITAIEAAKLCMDRGIDLIITDHHTPLETLPEAYAIVNPKLSKCDYPFKDICGAQVAWLLLGLVKKELSLAIDMKSFLDILCIAVIADIMPLKNINRALVKEGLSVLMRSQRPSSVIIRDFLNKSSITSEDIAFQIAPRINSAGRLEDASIALEFLTATTTNKAYTQFEKLNSLNEQRRETETQTANEALELAQEEGNVIVVAKEGWHEGVIGIVASRLVEHFQKPAIVLSINNGVAKGSARSIGNIDIYELIKQNSVFLNNFGGHKMAAGLGLEEENIDSFKNAINKSASKLDSSDFLPLDSIMGVLPSQEIDFELLELLGNFEPYGEANSRPLFLIRDAQIVEIKYFGKDKSHTKIIIRQFVHDRKSIELILFKRAIKMPNEKKLTCSYRVMKNEFNSAVSTQLIINKIYNY